MSCLWSLKHITGQKNMYNEATRESSHTQPYNDVMNTQTEEVMKRLELHIIRLLRA